MTPARRVAVVTPWFPTADLPYRGAFVQAMVDASAPSCDQLTVYHCDAWVTPGTAVELHRIRKAYPRLVPAALTEQPLAGGPRLRHIPIPMLRQLDHAVIAHNASAGLRIALRGEPLPEPVVHAHVGLPGGWAAVTNARPDARVFVTEHASYLAALLDQPAARTRYDELLHRCTRLLAVGDGVFDLLRQTYPHHEAKIGHIANPISFGAERPRPVTELRRWLSVGSLTERKRPDLVVEALAKCRGDDPSLTLTFVGDGGLEAALVRRANELGVGDAVRFAGPLQATETARVMREHDLLVHASRWETFGVVLVEAISAGLPVLATRSGAPERTLAGLERATGEVVDLSESPDSLVAGYWRLRDRFPDDLDLPHAQRTLAERFGYEAVGRAHESLWFPDQAPRPPTARPITPAPAASLRGHRVVILALGTTRRRGISAEVAAIARAGGQVTVLLDGDPRRSRMELPPEVTVVDISARYRRVLLRLGRKMVFGVPRRLSQLAGRGRAGPVAARAYKAYWRRVGRPVEQRVLLPVDRRLGPLARERLVVRVVREHPHDLLIVGDPISLPAAARLLASTGDARRIRFTLPRSTTMQG